MLNEESHMIVMDTKIPGGYCTVRKKWTVTLIMIGLLLSIALPALTQEDDKTHVVQPGETLYLIAVRYGVTVDTLAAANNITDPNRIYVGQVLVIPTPATPAETPLSSAPSSDTFYRARQIFLHGQSLGNRPDVFSKVGDSITATPLFLNPVGAGNLDLYTYTYLQPVVTFFSQTTARDHNSFANSSLAAWPGWTSFDLLDPARASPEVCRTGESPLLCEYRVTRPALALIMIGTNDVKRGTDNVTYRANLESIVQLSINMGVIPILSTIPDFPGSTTRVGELNTIIASVATENGLPIWNYWAMMRDLPNQGISADQVHPSAPPNGETGIFTLDNLQYGYTMRNLSALMILDELWKGALY